MTAGAIACRPKRFAGRYLRGPVDEVKTTGCPYETSAAVPQEPNFSDVLNDPIVVAVMRADGVSPDELARVLEILVCRALSRSARSHRGEET